MKASAKEYPYLEWAPTISILIVYLLGCLTGRV